MSKEEDELTAALAGFKAEAPPASLYRFHGARALGALRDGTLKLSAPKDFNDPFEMWAGITRNGLTADDVKRSLLAEQGLYQATAKQKSPGFVVDDAFRAKVAKAVDADTKNWDLHLENCRTSVSSMAENLLGVACFSAFSENELLGPVGIHHWGMYGDRHHGFVIEYDGERDFFKAWAGIKWLFPVEYVDERLQAQLKEFDVWTPAAMWGMLRRWSAVKCKLAWGNEKEWRLVVPPSHPQVIKQDSSGGTLHLLPMWSTSQPTEQLLQATRVIRRVILGAKMKADDPLRSAILSAVDQPHLAHVEVWQAKPCEKDFALKLIRIKPK